LDVAAGNLSSGSVALLWTIVVYDTKVHLLRETYFLCFNISKVLQNFVQV